MLQGFASLLRQRHHPGQAGQQVVRRHLTQVQAAGGQGAERGRGLGRDQHRKQQDGRAEHMAGSLAWLAKRRRVGRSSYSARAPLACTTLPHFSRSAATKCAKPGASSVEDVAPAST